MKHKTGNICIIILILASLVFLQSLYPQTSLAGGDTLEMTRVRDTETLSSWARTIEAILSVLRSSIIYQSDPAEIISSPYDGLATNTTPINVTGRARPRSKLIVNNMTTIADLNGSFSQPVSLNIGKNLITVTAVDQTGSEVTAQRTVIYDNVPPEITVVSPADKLETADNLLVVTGYTEPGVTVYVNEVTAQTDGKGNFSQAVDLTECNNNITIMAVDIAGNKTTVNCSVLFKSNRIENFKTPAQIRLGGRNSIQFTLGLDGYVTLKIYDIKGNCIRTLLNDRFSPAGNYVQNWDGKCDSGELAGEEKYRFVIEERDAGGLTLGRAELTQLAARFPYISKFRTAPGSFNPVVGGKAEITFDIPCEAVVTAKVYRGGTLIKTVAADLLKPAGTVTLNWDGRDDSSSLAGTGMYSLMVKAANPSYADFASTAKGYVTIENAALTSNYTGLAAIKSFGLSAEISPGEAASDGTIPVDTGIPVISGASLGQSSLKFGANIRLGYTLSENCVINVKIVDTNGNLVKKILTDAPKKAGLNSTFWDGRDDSGQYGAEGTYKFVINAVDNFGNSAHEQIIPFAAGYLPIFQDVSFAPLPYNPNASDSSMLKIDFNITHDALVTAEVINGYTSVKKLLNAQEFHQGKNSLVWNGRDSHDSIVGDGTYYIRLTAASPMISVFQSVYKSVVTVEKESPRITQVTVSPDPFKLTTGKQMSVRYSLSENARVSVGIYQGDTLIRNLVSEVFKRAGFGAALWNGKDEQGRTARQGIYTVRITAADAFGNTGEVSCSIEFIPHFSVYAVEPAKGATDVAVDSKIQVTFTGPVKNTVNFRHILIQVQGRNILYRGTLSGSTITLTPSAELAYGTTYNIKISDDAVEEKTGFPLQESYEFSFTTEGASRPDTDLVDLSDSITSIVTKTDNKLEVSVTVDGPKALAAITGSETAGTALIPVTVDSDVVRAALPARVIKKLAAKQACIQVRSPKAAVLIPAAAFEMDELADALDAESSDITIHIILEMPEPARKAYFQNLAKNQRLTAISGPVTFKIEAAAKDQTTEVDNLGSYATLVLYLPKGITANLVGGVEINSDTTLIPKPSVNIGENGLAGAGIRSKTTGTFGVFRSAAAFKDLINHWALQDINLLAARLIVSGVNQNSFAPDRPVTRSQFVTMVVKALGLPPRSETAVFTDVNTNAWYNGYLAAGAEAGIVSGFPDRTFKPELTITREEAAVIILRAWEWIVTRGTSTPSGPPAVLGRFKDKDKISGWAQVYVAEAVNNDLLQGYPNGTFAPGKRISRAECAVAVRRLLAKTGLI